MSTEASQFQRLRELFDRAAEMPVDQRKLFVDEQCADDKQLREDLYGMLESLEVEEQQLVSRGPLTGAIGAAVSATTRERRERLLGTTIGAYRLTSILGHGGAGTVYLGERNDRQYSGQVAIKVVEGAPRNIEVNRRFRAERQILASLNHPNIARLLDAGETEHGYPFLVMEYVHGEPINVYCDRLRLNLEERIEIFLKICSTVQYAHRNLIVHRDLKPANILVMPNGTPKLLDFGIAKLLDSSHTPDGVALTRLNERLLTPEYASPEQVTGGNVATPTDVYSLGVVLYELLTGGRPYDVADASQLELERIVCVVDPPRASSQVRRLANEAVDAELATSKLSASDMERIAGARHVSLAKLQAALVGDLDAILMRALRKEPAQRYDSVEQFADDLRHYLQNEPVGARQGNWSYLAQRFVRRHVFGLTTTAAFIVVLGAALVFVSIQAQHLARQRDLARHEQATAQSVANFMVDVFSASDPFQVDGREITAKELLEKSAASIQTDLGQEPAVRARLMEAIGRSLSSQGFPERATKLLDESLQLYESLEGRDGPSIPTVLRDLAKAQELTRDTLGSEQSLLRARDLLKRQRREASGTYADVLLDLAHGMTGQGRLDEAQSYAESALPLLLKAYGPKHSQVAGAYLTLAQAFEWNSDYDSMGKAVLKAVDIFKDTAGPANPDRLVAENMLAEWYLFQGRLTDAAPLIEHAFEENKRVFGSRSARLQYSLSMMIELRRAQGRLKDAESLAREFVAIALENLGSANVLTAYARITLGSVLWKRNKLSEAERELRLALVPLQGGTAEKELYSASARYFLGEVLLAKGCYPEAIVEVQRSLASIPNRREEAWRKYRAQNLLGAALYRSGRAAEGRRYIESSVAALEADPRANRETIFQARDRLASIDAARSTASR